MHKEERKQYLKNKEINWRKEYNDNVKRLCWKFWKSKQYIKNLNLKYSLSEIENGKLVKWEIICTDEIAMKKPTCIEESMYSFESGIV